MPHIGQDSYCVLLLEHVNKGSRAYPVRNLGKHPQPVSKWQRNTGSFTKLQVLPEIG